MALLWADSFDTYGGDNSALTQGLYNAATGVVSNTGQRHGDHCYQFTNGSGPGALRRNLGAFKTVFGMGYAVIFPTLVDNFYVAQVLDQNGAQCCRIKTTTDGRFQVNGPSDNQLALSGQVILANAYQHIEMKFDVNDGVEIRLNGVTVLQLTGANLHSGGTPGQFSQVFWGWTGGLSNIRCDDVVCWDTSGSYFNDFVGDKRVRAAALTADEATQDWTRNTGSTNYGALTEQPPDGDTTYLESASAGDICEFAFDGTPGDVVAIAGVFITTMSRKTDSGPCSVKTSLLSGGSVGAGNVNAISTLYTYYQDAFSVDPNTGVPFTIPDLDAATIRLERTL